MAAHVAFISAHGLGASTVYGKAPRVAELITTSVTPAVGTATALLGEVARVTASGAAVYVRMGKAGGTVSAATGVMLPNGASIDFSGLAAGDVLIAVDA